MEEIPNLKGRYFNVALCLDCWDRCNPDRKADAERRADIETRLREATKDWDKDDVAANRCPVCDENVHAGIYVRVNVEKLRSMRPR